MTEQFDVAVVGAGIAGLMAAHHALLEGCRVTHIMGLEPMGGLVCNVGEIHGYPAGSQPVSGIDLAVALSGENAELGCEQVFADAISLTQVANGFRLSTTDGEIVARQVIAATGASLRMLDVPGARELVGRGVSQCAWCDGALYKGKEVVVIGGGDAALEEALHLSQFASQVTIVTRGDGFRARQSYINRIADLPSVNLHWMSDVTEIVGDGSVTAVRLNNRETAATNEISCDGVFVFIGLEPNGSLMEGMAAFDTTGAVITNDTLETKTQGLYAIGAVRSGYRGRLVHALADAVTAAMTAAANCNR